MGVFINSTDQIFHKGMYETSLYVTAQVAEEVCALATAYHCYVEWYECGIIHYMDGNRFYEGHDTWFAENQNVNSCTAANYINNQALNLIKEDQNEGYKDFCIFLRKF